MADITWTPVVLVAGSRVLFSGVRGGALVQPHVEFVESGPSVSGVRGRTRYLGRAFVSPGGDQPPCMMQFFRLLSPSILAVSAAFESGPEGNCAGTWRIRRTTTLSEDVVLAGSCFARFPGSVQWPPF